MIELRPDPSNPEKVILSATVTLFLDKVLLTTLSDELSAAIRAQAIKDLQHSTAVKKLVAQAASQKLLQMLGHVPEEKQDVLSISKQ